MGYVESHHHHLRSHALIHPYSDKLVLGGGLVFTFLKAKGLAVGNSLVEDDFLDLARELMAKADETGVKLLLPTDILAASKFDNAVSYNQGEEQLHRAALTQS